MKCTIPEISWHNRDPVLSVDVQPIKASDSFYRLATGGTDSHVLIWFVVVDKGGVASVECATDLSRHTKPVNCVRFSPSGDLLASGDDEACIIIWKMKTSSDPLDFPLGEEESFKEQWTSVRVLRGHLQDVYDLSWSADSKNLISGSVDNTAILWDTTTGRNLGILSEHKGFVQGVAWDPCGQYVATISSDRVCRVYNSASRRVVSRLYKGVLPGRDTDVKPAHLFHDDTLKSFFRRLTFTPDGELLVVPSGLVEETDKKQSNSTIIFSRHCLNKPCMYLPSLTQHSIAVRCCPIYFTLRDDTATPLFSLPYRVVIAVATQSSVILYDTQHAAPFALISNIHYTRLTDLSWSGDGKMLVVSSTDGYCSVITFADGELGTPYTPSCRESKDKSLPESEEANMPLSEKVLKSPKSAVITQNIRDTPMEVDDFNLVYEGTVTEPVLEKNLSKWEAEVENNSEVSIQVDNNETSENRTETCTNAKNSEGGVGTLGSHKMSEGGVGTPASHKNSEAEVGTPGSHKKTPRRVQLITLSSPKSKKKLLD